MYCENYRLDIKNLSDKGHFALLLYGFIVTIVADVVIVCTYVLRNAIKSSVPALMFIDCFKYSLPPSVLYAEDMKLMIARSYRSEEVIFTVIIWRKGIGEVKVATRLGGKINAIAIRIHL